MDAAITVGQVLAFVAIAGAGLLVGAACLFVLAAIGKGYCM